MGCDIHMVLEKRVVVDGVEGWIGMHDFPTTPDPKEGNHYQKQWWGVTGRNYALFAALAGVRGDGPNPKGMPSDASELAHYLSNGCGTDGHSHSFCSIQEFLTAYTDVCSEESVVRREYVGALLEGGDAWVYSAGEMLFGYLDSEHYRVVFWFDN